MAHAHTAKHAQQKQQKLAGLRLTHQDGFTDDTGQHTPSQDRQVLQQEGWGHDQPRGADEERHEEVADAGELVQAVLLLVCG